MCGYDCARARGETMGETNEPLKKWLAIYGRVVRCLLVYVRGDFGL